MLYVIWTSLQCFGLNIRKIQEALSFKEFPDFSGIPVGMDWKTCGFDSLTRKPKLTYSAKMLELHETQDASLRSLSSPIPLDMSRESRKAL